MLDQHFPLSLLLPLPHWTIKTIKVPWGPAAIRIMKGSCWDKNRQLWPSDTFVDVYRDQQITVDILWSKGCPVLIAGATVDLIASARKSEGIWLMGPWRNPFPVNGISWLCSREQIISCIWSRQRSAYCPLPDDTLILIYVTNNMASGVRSRVVMRYVPIKYCRFTGNV